MDKIVVGIFLCFVGKDYTKKKISNDVSIFFWHIHETNMDKIHYSHLIAYSKISLEDMCHF